MKRLVLIILTLIPVSCLKNGAPGSGRRGGWDPHEEHAFQRNPPDLQKDSLLITGIEYPPGYDWVRDTAHNRVTANLLLFRGNKEQLRVPCGGDALWTAETDCHRILDGHLYTFATRDGCTIVGRDGEEVLRYGSEESIRGFAAEEGHILTLGQSIGGRGFSFRRDGRIMFLSDYGTICGSLDQGIPRSGAIYADNGHWYFSFKEDGRIHLVEDNLERALPDLNLLDAKVYRGRLLLAYTRKYGQRTSLFISDGGLEMQLPPLFMDSVRYASFICDGNQARIIADVAGVRYVWDAGSSRLMNVYRGMDCELYPRSMGDCAVITEKGRVRHIDPYGSPPGNYSFVSGACAAWAGSSFFAALSGLDGAPGLLLRDSIKVFFDINGPLTSLYME